MKKLILWLLTLAIVPTIAFADQLSDLEAQIEKMLREISTLQSSLGVSADLSPQVNSSPSVVPASSPASSVCISLVTNLGPGSRGSAVVSLQSFLRSLGYFTYPENTGYYGQVTVAAVQAFQRASGIVSSGAPATTGYGNVGPQTRVAINSRGCGASGDLNESTPIPTGQRYQVSFISPKGGEDVLRGQKKLIHWYAGAQTGTVSIYAVKSDTTTNAATIASNINVRSGYLFWTVPTNLAVGSYKLTMFLSGRATPIAIGPTFDVVGTSSGSSRSGSSSRRGGGGSSGSSVGVAVVSPNGGNYFTIGEDVVVKWTDGNKASRYDVYLLEGAKIKKSLEDVDPSYSGSNLITGFSTLGLDEGDNFKVKVCRANSTSDCDTSNHEFTIELEPNPLEVLSPYSGENLIIGSPSMIRWTDTSSDTLAQYDIDIIDRTQGYREIGKTTPVLPGGSRRVTAVIQDGITRTYSWTAWRPSGSPSSGLYGVRICRPGKVPCAQSASFSLLSTADNTMDVTCSPSPATVPLQGGAASVTWVAEHETGGTVFSYVWSGSDNLIGSAKSVIKGYSSAGSKEATVIVTDNSSGRVGRATCSATISTPVQAEAVIGGIGFHNPMNFYSNTQYREIAWNQPTSEYGKTYNIWLSNLNWPGVGGHQQYILDQISRADSGVVYRWSGKHYTDSGQTQIVTPSGAGYYFRICPADDSKKCKESQRFELIRH